MKEILNDIDKKSLILSVVYKISSYLCWFLYGIVAVTFINGFFNKQKLICLMLISFIIYTVRILFKHLYKRHVDDAYSSIKHSAEMYYFKRLEDLNSSTLEKIDKEYLANKILEVTYNIHKMINDVFEYMIPLLIGLIMFVVGLSSVHILIALLVLILLVTLLVYEYRKYEDEEPTNYNDLLKDFVLKLPDIRMLNAFSFCARKLDKNKNNNYCIMTNDIKYDLVYDLSMIALLFISIISTVFIIRHTIDILGLGAFFIIIGIKLKDLLYKVVPTIYNIKNLRKNSILLESYYDELKKDKYISEWKTINFRDAKLTYQESGIEIKIPNFEFNKGENVSILGVSGEGKSTLLYLLSGMYVLNEGKIIIDGKESDAKIDSMFITRNTKMFKFSLRDNLTLGNKIEDDDLMKLLKEIEVMDWFNELSDGLDTIIDINYVNLPDQVREKLNILRGIISSKDTLLLDEPTYDMEMDDEIIISNMIKKYWKKKSYIIVSHRPIFTTICKKHYFMKNHELLESEPLL